MSGHSHLGLSDAIRRQGEGGILPEEFNAAYRYIFEYVPNQYSVTEDNFKKVDAIEIKIGQSAKPGLGGHLPGKKVISEIARIRGFQEIKDFARLTGNDDVHKLSINDLCTTNSEISNHTEIEHV